MARTSRLGHIMPHDHPHGPVVDPQRLAHYQNMATAVRELLVDKGILTDSQIETKIKDFISGDDNTAKTNNTKISSNANSDEQQAN